MCLSHDFNKIHSSFDPYSVIRSLCFLQRISVTTLNTYRGCGYGTQLKSSIKDTNAHAQLISRGSINEYTYENGVQFEINSL